jgi:hypothetical protein
MFWFMARNADASWKKSPKVLAPFSEGKAEGGLKLGSEFHHQGTNARSWVLHLEPVGRRGRLTVGAVTVGYPP